MKRLLFALALSALAACQQAASPGSAGQQLAGAGGGGNGGGGAGSQVRVLVSGGQGLQARFPGVSRVLLTVADRAAPHKVALQLNLPVNGAPLPLNLPTGVTLDFIYDLFDAAGTYLASGSRAAAISQGSVVLPVALAAVPPGAPWVDPLTGNAVNGPVFSLTVSVFSGASMRPLPGAIVLLGNGQQLATDASGIANFIAAPAQTDVHVFAGGDAVSVLAFAGNALAAPMPESAPVSGGVTVNGGPTLAAGELMDVYLTDGMRMEVIGHAAGDASPLFSRLMTPMRGPIGVTGLIEQPADAGRRPDRGIALASAPGHDATAPLSAILPDPAGQPRLTTVADSYAAAAMPPGMAAASLVELDVFAVSTAGTWQLVSHRNTTLNPANRRDITIWPAPASHYVWRASVSDGYAEVQAWRSSASLANPPAWAWPAATPKVTAASAAAGAPVVRWADAGAQGWDGYVVELTQGAHQWRVFGSGNAAQVNLPAPPTGAVSPLTPGVQANAAVWEYRLDPAAGFNPANPDLWYLPRMLRFRARSSAFAFTP